MCLKRSWSHILTSPEIIVPSRCASWIAMVTFWQWSRKMQGRRARGCAACVCHASPLHSVGARCCAACVSLFVSPFRQQDSQTRAAVLLPRALDRWLLVTSQLFARVGKMLRPKRAWALDPQVTVSSPVGLNNITWQENDSTIGCWKPWSNGNTIPLAWTRKFATVSPRPQLCWEEKGQVELRWGESTRVQRRWEEKREIKRELRRCAQNEGRWKEMTRGEKSLEQLTSGFTICDKRSEVPEKSTEVCRSSYRQTLFLAGGWYGALWGCVEFWYPHIFRMYDVLGRRINRLHGGVVWGGVGHANVMYACVTCNTPRYAASMCTCVAHVLLRWPLC